MDHVSELVLAPFRDIVDKAGRAAENAAGEQPMLRAAQNLIKEGDRALHRLEPLCRKHLDVSHWRIPAELTDLLWEFDDYLGLDSFDIERYAELQSLCRSAAPKMFEILTRMSFGPAPRHNLEPCPPRLSPPSSPRIVPALPCQPEANLHHPMAMDMAMPDPGSAGSSLVGSPTSPLRAVEDATSDLHRLVVSQASTDLERTTASVPQTEAQPLLPVQPAQLLLMRSWNPRVAPLFGDQRRGHGSARRCPIAVRPESPVDPAMSLWNAGQNGISPAPLPAPSCSTASDYDSDDGRQSSSSVCSSNSVLGRSFRTRRSNLTEPIPEEELAERAVKPLPQLPPARRLPLQPQSQRFGRPQATAAEYVPSAAGEGLQQHITMSHEADNALPMPATSSNYTTRPGASYRPPAPCAVHPLEPGLEVSARIIPRSEMDAGLIPVETPATSVSDGTHTPTGDCAIRPTSSFFHHKGFCEGAKEAIRGDIGVRRTQKPVRRAFLRTVARCTSCLYELDFSQMEMDLTCREEGNHSKSDIGYRLRFLQKSHLAAKRADDVHYGCLFCIRQGRTLDESDATVFFTTKALFAHLARHPRPLPEVPGITVVDGPEMPDHVRNDYDLHFTQAPAAHPAHEHAAEIAGQPTGVAKAQARRVYGQKLPFDRTEALELARGARLTGIAWPPKYGGDWMVAWHDGTFASVPTDLIKLDPPPADDISMDGTSHVRARARWKFSPKDKERGDWLRFDKNETITNIGWTKAEHWCWSGINAKGQWGIFPRAFIDTSTVHEPTAEHSDRAASLSSEKNKPSGMLSIFSARRPSGRPASVADSTSSSERYGFRLGSRGS
ncbi:hypothetical protein RJ55_08204 [Drechmeria coniospora]|nr:hypothetical protein RJ55_08204 [Drechmeria coniospora]